MPRFSLRGISYVLGELRDIKEIPALRDDPSLLARVRHGGFHHWARADQPVMSLAREAAEQAIARAGLGPEAFDLQVITTFRAEKDAPQEHKDTLDLGLPRARVVELFLEGCTGASEALRTTRDLMEDEGLQRALVVCTGVAPTPEFSRVYDYGLAILSDAAAAFVVERDAPGDWELLAVEGVTTPGLARTHPTELLAGQLGVVRQVTRAALTAAEIVPEACNRLVMNNLALQACQLFASRIGFEAERCWFENIGRIGHCFASDTLVNLVDAQAAHPLPPGATCLMLSNSETSWGAVVLRRGTEAL